MLITEEYMETISMAAGRVRDDGVGAIGFLGVDKEHRWKGMLTRCGCLRRLLFTQPYDYMSGRGYCPSVPETALSRFRPLPHSKFPTPQCLYHFTQRLQSPANLEAER